MKRKFMFASYVLLPALIELAVMVIAFKMGLAK